MTEAEELAVIAAELGEPIEVVNVMFEAFLCCAAEEELDQLYG